MAIRSTGQFSFVDALAPHVAGGGGGRLDRLHGLVKWYRFQKLLAPLRGRGAGPPGYPPLQMFKILLLQSLYGLSDAEMEEALGDRLSFRRFAGLALTDPVPDHSTICRFRNLLVEGAVLDRLFAELDRQLEKAGVMLKRGTMLDATVIETSAARPPMGETSSSDPDARFTSEQGKPGSLRLQGAFRRGRGLRPDPLGGDDAGQRQRHRSGRSSHSRRRAGGA